MVDQITKIRRRYGMGRRAEAVAATRHRIVEATMTLHRECGIAATSMRDIAERVNVGIGTAYHHFPTYEDAIRACGARPAEVTRPPTPDIFEGVSGVEDRLARLVEAIFRYYDRHPTLSRAARDQDRLPVLREFLQARRAHLQALVTAALAPPPSPRQVQLVLALTAFEVHRSLREGGATTAEAARQVTEVLVRWLREEGRDAR